MYLHDDRETARAADRLIAAIIGGACGFFFGGLLGLLSHRFLGSTFGLPWLIALGFGLYAFLAPSRSRDLWSRFWEGILDAFARSRL